MVTKTKPCSVELIPEGGVGAFKATYRTGTAVMKLATPRTPQGGKRAAHGVAAETMPYREVAFYELAKMLGLQEVVPETVLTEYKGCPASAQEYLHAMQPEDIDERLKDSDEWEAWLVAFRETMRRVPKSDLVKITLLDFLACARDRHANNYGVVLQFGSGDENLRLRGWDNAASFGLGFKRYHSVVHKAVLKHSFDIAPYWDNLARQEESSFIPRLSGLIGEEEAKHTWLRLQFVLRYPHRLPWAVFSRGAVDSQPLPSYAHWFPGAHPPRQVPTIDAL
jgi:hypothetical protein